MSSRQIANIFNCDYWIILGKMVKYKIPRREPNSMVHIKFNNYQQQVLEGLMLGDGHLEIPNRGINPVYLHTDKHKEFLEWLQKELGISDISKIYPRYYPNTKIPSRYNLYTRSISSLLDEHKRWYPDGKGTRNKVHRKVIAKDIKLTLINTLFWYLGDGTYNRGRLLFTNHLSLNDANFLTTQLKKLLNTKEGIIPELKCRRYYRVGQNELTTKRFYIIGLNTIITRNFFKLISDLNIDIPECYQYKFGVNPIK